MIELFEGIIEGIGSLFGWLIETAQERPGVAAVVAISFIVLVCGVIAFATFCLKSEIQSTVPPPTIAAPAPATVEAPPPVVPAIHQGGQSWERHPVRDKAVSGAKKLWAKVKDRL
jgi:hypothetical protein